MIHLVHCYGVSGKHAATDLCICPPGIDVHISRQIGEIQSVLATGICADGARLAQVLEISKTVVTRQGMEQAERLELVLGEVGEGWLFKR